MATVIVSSTVKGQVVPADVVVQGYKVTVTGLPEQVVQFPSATFQDVAPGDYVATVALVDKDGVVIGDAQSATFNVPVPTQTVSVPDVVSVQVS